MRSCVSCRRPAPKGELLRLVRRDAEVAPDPAATSDGRGAYLCRDARCADRAVARNPFRRALRAAVTIPEPTIDFIREWQRSESTR